MRSASTNSARFRVVLGAVALPALGFGQFANHGAEIVVEADAVIAVDGGLSNDVDGQIVLEGGLVLAGDLTNAGAFSAATSGELVLLGESPQTVSGLDGFPLAHLTASGPGGVLLASPLQLTAGLWLEGGVIDLGDHDLTLGSTAGIGGTPSVRSMVATTGTGALVVPVERAGTYHFPLGTLAGGAAYTPVSIEVVAANGGSGRQLAARVQTDAGAVNPSLADYVDRLWTLDPRGGLEVSDARLTFTWAPGDEVGSMGALHGGLFTESGAFQLLEQVDAANRRFTTRVGELGTFTAGESRAFEDDVLEEGAPEHLQFAPSLESGSGEVDLGGAFGGMAGFTYALGRVSNEALFASIAVVDGELLVDLAEGAVGESSVTIAVTNEYGVTSEKTLYVTEQPDPQLVRSELNHVSGYFEQDYRLENISAVRPLDLTEVLVGSLPADTTIARATLLEGGAEAVVTTGQSGNSVRFCTLLRPGEAVTLRLEFVARSRQPEGLVLSYGPYGPFAAGMMDGEWIRLSEMGHFFPAGSDWFFHDGLGWLYMGARRAEGSWLYHTQLGWLWTRQGAFPYLFSSRAQAWLYYETTTRSPAWLYDFGARQWMSL